MLWSCNPFAPPSFTFLTSAFSQKKKKKWYPGLVHPQEFRNGLPLSPASCVDGHGFLRFCDSHVPRSENRVRTLGKTVPAGDPGSGCFWSPWWIRMSTQDGLISKRAAPRLRGKKQHFCARQWPLGLLLQDGHRMRNERPSPARLRLWEMSMVEDGVALSLSLLGSLPWVDFNGSEY